MKRSKKNLFAAGIGFLAAFVVWTVLVLCVDVEAIGPQGTNVGFATLNGFVHRLTGANMLLYEITDWLGIVPISVCLGFAVIGAVQWIKRKSLLMVDRSILLLGIFYVAVMAAYILFEFVVINYRPVLIEGRLESSYPSSTTMLVSCIMPTAIMQLEKYIKGKVLKRTVALITVTFVILMIVARLLSGVHWVSDIIGGILISTGLVLIYYAFLIKSN